MAIQIQIRRDLAATWTSDNPTLAQGEMGYETDTGKLKFGDGLTAWTGLSYFGGTGAVSSVSNSDGTLTISPTTGAVVASIALGHSNTWTGLQKFTKGDLGLLGSSTGYTLLESGLSGSSDNTLTLPITASDTLAALGTAETFTALQTFGNQISFGGAQLNVTSLTSGNLLQYNGTNWVNVTVTGSTIQPPYDYYIYQTGGDYVAVPNPNTIGGSSITNTTPDVCALLQSIDTAQQAAFSGGGIVTKIFVDRGTYAAATTFKPGQNYGYDIEGVSSGLNNQVTAEVPGTIISYSPNSGYVVDCSVNWHVPSGSQGQQFFLRHIAIVAASTSGGGLNLYGLCAGELVDCEIYGNSTPKAGSNGLIITSSGNFGPFTIRNCAFVYWNTGFADSCDEVYIYDTSFATINTHGITKANGQESTYENITGYNVTGTLIHDTRSASSSSLLTIINPYSNANNTYDNSSGGYYVILGSLDGITDYRGIETNLPIKSTIAQTTHTAAGGTGTSSWSMPEQGSSYKRFIIQLAAYGNNSSGADTITYTVAFTKSPKIVSDDTLTSTTSTTTLTIPAIANASPITGWIIIEGY